MKLRMIATALMLAITSAAIATHAGAAPWRGGWRGGFYVPRPVVRVCPPPVPVIAPPVIAPPVVVGGGYYGGGYYGGYAHPYYHYRHDYDGYHRGYGHRRW